MSIPDCASTSCSSVSFFFPPSPFPSPLPSPPAPSSAAAAAGGSAAARPRCCGDEAPPAGELARVRTRLAGLSRPSAPGAERFVPPRVGSGGSSGSAGSAGGSGGSAGRAGRAPGARGAIGTAGMACPPRPPGITDGATRGAARPIARLRCCCCASRAAPPAVAASCAAAPGAGAGGWGRALLSASCSASTPTCALSCAINWVLSTWPALYACSSGLRSGTPGVEWRRPMSVPASIEPEEERAAGAAAAAGAPGALILVWRARIFRGARREACEA